MRGFPALITELKALLGHASYCRLFRYQCELDWNKVSDRFGMVVPDLLSSEILVDVGTAHRANRRLRLDTLPHLQGEAWWRR